MATLRPRTGKDQTTHWNLYWPLGGRRSGGKTQSLTFLDETEARLAKEIAERHPAHSRTDAEVLAELTGEEITVSVPTVASILPAYRNSLHNVGERDKRKYLARLRLYILPVIGHVPVDKVTTKDIDDIMAKLSSCDCDPVTGERGVVCSRRRQGRRLEAVNGHAGGLAKRTRDRYYNGMKSLFSYAVREGLRKTNPVKEISYRAQSLSSYNSGRKEDEHFYMTKAQYLLLRSHFTPESEKELDYRPFLDFMVQTGARFSEATATKKRAIDNTDPDKPVLRIVDAWKEDEHGNPVIEEPKRGSNRDFVISPDLVETLTPSLVGRKATDTIFHDMNGGPLDYDLFYNKWDKAALAATRCPLHPPTPLGTPTAKGDLAGRRCGDNGGLNEKGKPCGQWVAAGWNRCADHRGPGKNTPSECACTDILNPKRLPKRPIPYDLRHTNVAWLIEQGFSPLEIAHRLGHTVPVLEKVYAGILTVNSDKIIAATSLR